MAETESLAAGGLRALGLQGREQAAAARQVAAPLPVPQGPSQAEMAADPTAPPTTIVRPQVEQILARAAQMVKQGLISQAQYQALVARVGQAQGQQ